MNNSFDNKISSIQNSVKNILKFEGDKTRASRYWKAYLRVLEYIMDLTPDNLKLIRLHTELFSGENLNTVFFSFPPANGTDYAITSGYNLWIENMPSKYHISEPNIPDLDRKFGATYHDKILNPELVRYQSYFENFYSAGMLDSIEKSEKKSIVLEIGGGYGAIGHHLMNFFPGKVCYVAVDLPVMLMFTAAYIAANNPDAKIFCYDPADPSTHMPSDEELLKYDLVLVPNHKLSVLDNLKRIDYAINTISMAEMDREDVQEYIDFIKPRLKGFFYFQNYCWPELIPLHEYVGKHFITLPKIDSYDSEKQFEFNKYTFYYTTDKSVADELSIKEIKISAFNKCGIMNLGTSVFSEAKAESKNKIIPLPKKKSLSKRLKKIVGVR